MKCRLFLGLLATTLVPMFLLTVAPPASAQVIEDFESGNLNAYTYVNGSGPDVVSSTYAHDGSFGLGTAAFSDNPWIYRDDAGSHVQQGETISAWTEFVGNASARSYFGFGATSAGTLSFVLAPNTGQILFQENPGYAFSNLTSAPQTFLADHWYREEVVWGVGGSLTGNLYDSDGVTLLNSVTTSSTLYSSGGIAFRGFSDSKAFDTVTLIGSAAVPEPGSVALFVGMSVTGASFLARRRKAVK